MSTRTSKHCLVTKKCMGCTCGSRQKPGQRQQLEEAAAVAGQSRCLRAVPWHPEPIGRAPGEHSEVRQQEAMSTHVVALPAKLQAGRATGRSLMHVSPAHHIPARHQHKPHALPVCLFSKNSPKHPIMSYMVKVTPKRFWSPFYDSSKSKPLEADGSDHTVTALLSQPLLLSSPPVPLPAHCSCSLHAHRLPFPTTSLVLLYALTPAFFLRNGSSASSK